MHPIPLIALLLL